jgi:hypothetical protein
VPATARISIRLAPDDDPQWAFYRWTSISAANQSGVLRCLLNRAARTSRTASTRPAVVSKRSAGPALIRGAVRPSSQAVAVRSLLWLRSLPPNRGTELLLTAVEDRESNPSQKTEVCISASSRTAV